MVAVKKYLESREVNLKSETQIKPGSNRPPTIDTQGRPNSGLPKRCKRIAKAIGISDTNLRKLEYFMKQPLMIQGFLVISGRR